MDHEQVFNKHRHSIRLPGYDYSAEGSYFITLVTHEREHLFGEIVDGEMRLNEFGKIVREEWERSTMSRKEIELDMDEFVVMPNHIHGIVHIFKVDNDSEFLTGTDDWPIASLGDGEYRVRAYGHTPLPQSVGFHSPSKTLGSMIRGYKSSVTTRINTLRGTPREKVWLRNYYEHIITTEKEYENIVNYICLNPLNWGLNDEYGDRKGV